MALSLTVAGTVFLAKGRERSLVRRHPWVFSGAVSRVDGEPSLGDVVAVADATNAILGYGAYSPESAIRVRMWSFGPDAVPNEGLIADRLRGAIAGRRALGLCEGPNPACRLVHGENDGLPGLIVDRYGEYLVCQFLSAGAERIRPIVLTCLVAELSPTGILDRSDADARQREGLPPVAGVIAGQAPSADVRIREGDVLLPADLVGGQKTGGYLDQRLNRLYAGPICAGKDVLNCFSYTGGFSLQALANGCTSVVNVDASAEALELGRKAREANGFDAVQVEDISGDAFRVLRTFRDSRREFDVVIMDPPKFADTKARLQGACRGYKDINLLACKLLRPGGNLLTFSCSAAMTPDLFAKIVADAALDAGRNGRIIRTFEQGPDHPVALSFPEGRYLTGLHVALD